MKNEKVLLAKPMNSENQNNFIHGAVSGSKQNKKPKNLKVKKQKSPFSTQKYFAPGSLTQGKGNEFKFEKQNKENIDSQNAQLDEERINEPFSEKEDSKINLTGK